MAASTDPSCLPPPIAEYAGSLWRGERARLTFGLFSLSFLVAFESMAVVTIMPVVVDDLNGLSWYAIAFAAPLSVSIFSRTVSGPWIDARGPRAAVLVGTACFAAGLILCGTAATMPMFLAGRAVQGLGMGTIGVAMYVALGQGYPESLRPRAMTILTTAWMLPAVAGPALAAWMAHLIGWRSVFLVVPALAAVSVIVVWPTLPGRPAATDAGSRVATPVWASVIATIAVLVLSVAGQGTLPWWPAICLVAVVVIGFSTRRLVPPRTFTGGRGLPSVIGAHSVLAAGYFAAEAHVPLALVRERGLDPAAAGLALTAAALTWSVGSFLVARPALFGGLLSTPTRRAAIGAAAIVAGVCSGLLVMIAWIPVTVIVIVWAVGGLGMGAAMAVLSVHVLTLSAPADHGRTSASLQTGDAVVQSVALAGGSVLFAALLNTPAAALTAVFSSAVAVTVLGAALTSRIRDHAAGTGDAPDRK